MYMSALAGGEYGTVKSEGTGLNSENTKVAVPAHQIAQKLNCSIKTGWGLRP